MSWSIDQTKKMDSAKMKSHVIIIAEAGVNHNGNISMAKELIDAAAAAGVDYVKFQTFQASKLVSATAEKAAYQRESTGEGETQFQMLKKLELDEAAHDELIAYCESRGVKFLSTAFDEDSVDMLYTKGIRIGKIPSGELTNKPFLVKMAQTFPQIVLSTGMSTMDELVESVNVLVTAGSKKENITILHCNTEYPTPMKDVNLKAMLAIQQQCETAIGYSDHTLGIEVPIAAVALGATLIEKHFTLDKNLPGPDHKASLEPEELKSMVQSIRNIEKAISGSGIKEPSDSELKNMAIARKSIHIKMNLEIGQTISVSDLVMLRPGNGISPMRMDEVIGKKVIRPIQANQQLKWEDFEA